MDPLAQLKDSSCISLKVASRVHYGTQIIPRINPLRSSMTAFKSRFVAGTCWKVKSEEEDGPQFAAMDETSTGGLGGTSAEVFGPPAILAIGCTDTDEEFLKNAICRILDGEGEVVAATEQMLNSTLSEAFQLGLLTQAEASARPLGMRRTIIFSGMYTHEVMEIIGAYHAQGLPKAIFAAAVPNNWNSNLRELVEEVYDDDRRMHQQ